MNLRRVRLNLGVGFLLLAAVLLSGCGSRTSTPAPTASPAAPGLETAAPAYPIPGQLFPNTDHATPLPTLTAGPYPLPGLQQTPLPMLTTAPYPLPGLESTAQPSPSPSLTLTAAATQAAVATASATLTPEPPQAQPTATLTETPLPTASATTDAYPPPGAPTQPVQQPPGPYPPPGEQPTQPVQPTVPYPPPGATTEPTHTPAPSQTPAGFATLAPTNPSAGATATVTPIATGAGGTAATQAALTPTEYIPQPLGSATPAAGLRTGLTIWHSWDRSQRELLSQTIRAFQGTFPDVTFDVLYVPAADLQQRYAQAAYHGGGPSLLLGPSDWGAALYDQQLVADLLPYMSPAFEASLAAPALQAGRYRNAQVGLPYAMQGVLLYRNLDLLPEPAADWDELLRSATAATRGGRLGIYLDWGPYFSGGLLQALGGQWLAENGQPRFQQQEYAAALTWLELMQQTRQAGGVQFGLEDAGRLFRAGRVGVIAESSTRLNELRQALGADRLALDAWPAYQGRTLGGFVQTEQFYLNANLAERAPAEQRAALIFMGMFMTPEIQNRLAEVGFIPTALAAEVRDAHLAQAQAALQTGVAFPPAWQAELRSAYWSEMLLAARSVYDGPTTPRQALEKMYRNLQER